VKTHVILGGHHTLPRSGRHVLPKRLSSHQDWANANGAAPRSFCSTATRVAQAIIDLPRSGNCAPGYQRAVDEYRGRRASDIARIGTGK